MNRLTLLIAVPACFCWASCAPAAEEAHALKLSPVEPAQVKLGGEIGRRIGLTIHKNLLVLDTEKDFLAPFRAKTGAPEGYIGLGKLLDSAVSFAAYSREPQVIAFKDKLISELLKTQLPDGYIGTFAPARRIRVYWDLHEMAYVIQALVNNYRSFNDEASLAAARRLGDYIMSRRKPAEPPDSVGKLNTERAFIALGQAAADRKYIDYAAGANLRNWPQPVGGHAYTFMNLCLAQLDLYQLEEKPDPKLLAQSRRVIDFLTRSDGLMIHGTCSRGEGFHTNQDGRGNLGESCATAYLIRLLHHLMQIEENPFYGDMMERAIYNALFAAQSPDGRSLRYFTCIEGPRVYYRRDGYCCPGNWRRIVAELPQMVYYRSADTIAVNLYTASESKIALGKDLAVKLSQETDYPNSGGVLLAVEPSKPATFALKLRIPRWCEAAAVSVNGKPVANNVEGGQFFSISREWRKGDKVQLTLPMSIRLIKGRKMQAGKVAVMRGPVLFCIDPRRMQPAPAVTFDAASIEGPVPDKTVRPDGLGLRIKGWSATRDTKLPPDVTALLTEFTDPGGEMTYFPAKDAGVGVDDELSAGKTK